MKIIQWGNKCRRVNEVCEVLQGSFGVGLYCKNTKTFVFVFFFPLICFQIDIMTRFCCTKHRGGGKRNRNPGRHDQYIQYVLYFFPPSLASCLPGNTTGAKTAACGHLLTSIPNGSLPLWQMLYCFDSSLQLFPVGTCGVHGGNGVSGSFHPDAVLVSLLPNLSLKHDKKLTMTQLSGLNAQNT